MDTRDVDLVVIGAGGNRMLVADLSSAESVQRLTWDTRVVRHSCS